MINKTNYRVLKYVCCNANLDLVKFALAKEKPTEKQLIQYFECKCITFCIYEELLKSYGEIFIDKLLSKHCPKFLT